MTHEERELLELQMSDLQQNVQALISARKLMMKAIADWDETIMTWSLEINGIKLRLELEMVWE